MDFISLPEPLAAAMHFIEKTNEHRANGVEIDTAQVLAAKVACVALREYFSRLNDVIAEGQFDPSRILEAEETLYGEEI